MLDFFSTIADSIGLFLQFIGNTVSGLLQVISIAIRSFGWLTAALGFMPSVLIGFASAGILLAVFYHFIGR